MSVARDVEKYKLNIITAHEYYYYGSYCDSAHILVFAFHKVAAPIMI